MTATPLDRLIRIRQFPPVVHPRHARELLAVHDAETLAEWTAGYAITLPEHRLLLEDLLASLAWGETGKAVLINGVYGTGKSHLLVLLHLLTALPDAWTPFLQAHPTFRRYAQRMQTHRRLVVHFSLDEYGPQRRVEGAIGEEVARTLVRAGIPEMAGWASHGARPDAWAELMTCLGEHGYDGLLLLVDELSLFLAGKSPARREGDAAFLQFLAGWSAHGSVWLIGALQRNLADVGALRTHSWRQVEDRFQRYTLSPQEIGRMLRDKLVQRLDPPAIRQMIAADIVPAAAAQGLQPVCRGIAVGVAVSSAGHRLAHGSGQRVFVSASQRVEILQQLGHPSWLQRRADRLITPLDLFGLVAADLLCDESLERLWQVVNLLADLDGKAPDPAWPVRCSICSACSISRNARPRSPSCANGSSMALLCPRWRRSPRACHHLRRYGAYLAVTRDADPGAEVFRLEIDDEIGALATTRMQEMRHEFAPDDAARHGTRLAACTEHAWPLAAALADQLRLSVPWGAAERHVLLSRGARPSHVRRSSAVYEGLLACQADGQVLMLMARHAITLSGIWHAATALLDGPATGTLPAVAAPYPAGE